MDGTARGRRTRAQILAEAARLFTEATGDFEAVAQRAITLLVSRETPAEPLTDDDRVGLQAVARAASLAFEKARLSAGRERFLEEERASLLARERQTRQLADRVRRLKDEFLSTLSHELRTPLNAIVGWTHVLQSGDADQALAAKALAAIERNAQAQTKLVTDLLDLASLASGQLPIGQERVEMVPLLRAALEGVRPAADAKRIQLLAELDPDAGPVRGDAARLQQVVWHLLANAVKFTARGGRVDLSLKQSGPDIVLEVTDNGSGIGPEFLAEVFDSFRQADGGTSRSHQGLGVGLTLARHLVEMHGGQISARSAGLGQGASFTVRIPALTEDEASVMPALSAFRRPHLDGLSVLLVEGETAAREALTVALQAMGASVTAVPSAEAALEAIDRAVPHVILAGVALPGMDGCAFLREVRAVRAPKTPAIALTGHAHGEGRARALKAGFDLHLPRPVHPGELSLAIARLVGIADPGLAGADVRPSPERLPSPRPPRDLD